MSNKNNKFKISALTQNEEFELPDGLYSLYSISDIQGSVEHILKRHKEKTVNPSIRIHVNKTENRIRFKIKTGYHLKFFTPEITKLHGNTKSKITKNENGENLPYLEITEVVLVHCNIVNDYYQQNSRVLYKFVPNNSFDQLLDISQKFYTFLKIFDSEFLYIEVWFTEKKF